MTAAADLPILVLDDDVAHAASVRELLEAYDYRVATSADPAGALPGLLRGEFPILILDLNMPGFGGLDVLARLAEAHAPVNTIVLSGETELGMVAPVLRLGASDYLPKPCDPQQLLTSLGNAVARVRLERENQAMAARVRADQALHEFMLDASPDPVFMLDPEGSFRFANRRFRELFAAGGELIGTHWAGVLGPDLAALLQHRFDERRTGDRATHHYEFRHGTADGVARFFDLAATGLYEANGTPAGRGFVGTYGVLRDLTDQRQAEAHRLALQQRLQQTSKMEAIGQIAGGIAHDFNNILASIIGYAELVRNAHARLTPAQIEGFLDEVIGAGHRARDLIAQMLTFTRAGRSAAQPVDVRAALQDVSRMLRAAIPSAIELRTEFADGTEPVRADPVQLQQIIINLLVNARDAIDGRGTIRVTLRQDTQSVPCAACGEILEGDHVVLAVADSGHGITDAVRARMFEMYFTTREPGHGTGIGLWLVNRLVHEYEGHVTVVSSPGSGATFEIHLPPADRPGRDRAPVPVEALRAGRIVLVDDEVSVANVMSEVLRDAGYEVVVFTESLPALRYLETHHASVAAVLTDQQMPLMTGLTLAERIRELSPTLPIALVTAYLESSASVPEAPFDHVLAKPFRMDQLLEVLDTLLARRTGSPIRVA
ncbi:MAG: response regulator [Pseudomonadales bacterium]|nr:response regulator [Pseudomonadales bacterium]